MGQPIVVVCDDEELIRWSLSTHLEREGYQCVGAEDGEVCLERVEEHAPALLVLDLKMPKLGGLDVLRELRRRGHELPVIVLTAHGGVDSAIEATRLGAAAFLSKPFDVREVALQIEKVLHAERLKHEVHYYRRRHNRGYGDFVGGSPALEPMFDILARLEEVDAPTVLITGESGTGKDVVARTLHAKGPRKSRPFVAIDCASLPEQLIESELFGHERGAFTDAKTLKQGLFEVADGGVVFLDEIGELPINTQSKLLRALEERTFKRVGGTRRFSFDVGVFAATNRDLKKEVAQGGFREDLFFRLDVISIEIPPLRDRREDVSVLVNHFLDKFARSHGREMPGVAGDAMELLESYNWPGNVRELRNLMERLVLLGPSDVVHPDDLPSQIRWAERAHAAAGPFELPSEGVSLEAVERSLIQQALDRTDGNQTAAARLLGLTRYQLRYRAEKHGL
ncbi:MAG: sigma-54 dependent transcriptional regulator [Myxococcales bacterium]|nr:sigma-54 dependent transcriptional regulator [Myxococcales bacterium]